MLQNGIPKCMLFTQQNSYIQLMFKSLYVHKVYGLGTFKEALQRFQFVICVNFFVYNLTFMPQEPSIFLSLIYHNFGFEIYGRMRMIKKT